MNAAEYKTITDYVFNSCGIVLGTNKEYLVKQRLAPLLPELGFKDLSGLAGHLHSGLVSFVIREKIVNAITTNETSWFRDGHPFDAFRDKILPDMFRYAHERKERHWPRRGAKVRIWSAAVSTGQEAYSLAMLIADAVRLKGMGTALMEDFGILGTDISSNVLAKAMLARYSDMEIARGLPAVMYNRYFVRDGDYHCVKEEIRRLVEFKSFNLQENVTQIGGFDVIFCRNILIYFTEAAKKRILSQFFQILTPGGYLMLGAAENLYNLNNDFKIENYGATTFYRKP